MRFKSRIRNAAVFEKVLSSLASLSAISWCRLTDEDIQFTAIPEHGSQCWSRLAIETIFEKYMCQSATEKNTINLEVPLQALSRALKSAQNANDIWIKLTKKYNIPMLSLTIHSSVYVESNNVVTVSSKDDEFGDFEIDIDLDDPEYGGAGTASKDKQTIITHDIPVKVLHPTDVGMLHEPRLREPDVHIYMPNLAQLKSVSDRFTKLAISTTVSESDRKNPRLEISANMHGSLKLAVKTDVLNIASQWTNLVNPELDGEQLEGGDEAVQNHPSTRMRLLGGPDGQNEAGWAKVRINARDFAKVLSVGRVSSRVVGCLLDDTCLVMYCWIGSQEDETDSCLTYYISSYAA